MVEVGDVVERRNDREGRMVEDRRAEELGVREACRMLRMGNGTARERTASDAVGDGEGGCVDCGRCGGSDDDGDGAAADDVVTGGDGLADWTGVAGRTGHPPGRRARGPRWMGRAWQRGRHAARACRERGGGGWRRRG